MIKKLIKLILPHSILHFLFSCISKFDIWRYNSFVKDKIIKELSHKDTIKVMFLVINVGMWKSNKLFKLLLDDEKFSPFIVTFFIPGDSVEYMEYAQNTIDEYFKRKNYPVIDTFDISTKTCKRIGDIEGDVFFYPQPYYDSFSYFPRKALFGYIPYDYPIQDDKVFHGRLYHNVCWRIFAVNDNYKKMEEKYSSTKGQNVKVVGYSNADYYFDGHNLNYDVWKNCSTAKKRIIWAPHHSILSSDTMDQSMFLELAYPMLDFAKHNKDLYQIVFKPHPRLKDKLLKHKDWGVKKTNDYYYEWANGDNTAFVEGEYIDLFLTSDAMIHDCSSFIAEYLYTNHPVMFTKKSSANLNLHGDDIEIFNAQYIGSSFNDVKRFLNDISEGKDLMKDERIRVVNEYLRPSDKRQVCEKIYSELQSLISEKRTFH